MKRALLLNLGLRDYLSVWELQRSLVMAKSDRIIDNDLFLILEHNPVFTIGKRGSSNHILVSSTFLSSKNIPIYRIERGGDITYHGPGQLICYPIIDIKRAHLGVREFVDALEEVMIYVAATYGIYPHRNPLGRGIWLGDRKLGSIGIAIKAGISFHGFALNVNNSLEPFSWIDPCGLKGIRMTSIREALGREVEMDEVYKVTKIALEEIFNISLKEVHLDRLKERLGKVRGNSGNFKASFLAK